MAGQDRASQSQHTAMSSLSTAVITELPEFISSNAQLNRVVSPSWHHTEIIEIYPCLSIQLSRDRKNPRNQIIFHQSTVSANRLSVGRGVAACSKWAQLIINNEDYFTTLTQCLSANKSELNIFFVSTVQLSIVKYLISSWEETWYNAVSSIDFKRLLLFLMWFAR